MARKVRKSKYTAPDPNQLQEDREANLDFKGVIKDERTRKITGAVALLIALFLFFAFASYLFTWEEDQDQVFREGAGILMPNDLKIANLLGALGAYLSHIFFYKGFGIASFLFCPFFGMLGINLLFAESYFSLKRNLRYTLSGLLVVSIVASFAGQAASFSWGGAVGDMICNWLMALIGKLGTAAVIILIVFAYIIWRFNPSFKLPARKVVLPETNASLAQTDQQEITPGQTTKEGNGVVVILPKQKGANEGMRQGKEESKEAAGLTLISKEGAESPAVDVMGNPITKTVNELYGSGAKLIIDSDPFDSNAAVDQENPEAPDTDEPEESALDEDQVIPTLHLNQQGRRKPASGGDITLEINEVATSAEEEPEVATTSIQKEPYEPTLDLKDYQYPSIDLLESHGSELIVRDTTELDENKNQIIATLRNYSIEIQKISATVGPTVTLYEIVPAAGVRISRIKNLEDDIALSLAALGIRIIAPIPGKGTIGIEVPNAKKSIVSMRSLVASEKFQKNSFSLPIALGKKINNEDFIVDLASMPHLLMAGATGQGKSVGLNAILVSLLYKKHPSQLKFVLVDPKKVELSVYSVITNHFLAKLPNEEDAIITDTKKVISTLNSLCIEMDNRYDLLKEAGCRNIKEYNTKFIERRLSPQKGHQFLPFIVLVVDEFADLIMTAGKEVEMPIARLAQLARAVGIHLIIATQRPSVNIITGTIKANFPARIAFKVSSKIDSRTILDAGGAEQLIGKGDMLVSYNGDITRLQCAFVDTPEVEKITKFIGYQEGNPKVFELPEVEEKDTETKDFDPEDRDALFEDAARLIVQNQVGSTSLIQRRMKLGYNRAGRLMDQLEAAGVVGPGVGSKAREVLIKTEYELEDFLDSTR